MKVSLVWKDKMKFDAPNGSKTASIIFDSSDPEIGGEGKGHTPKEAFLQSLAGCSGMDILHILGKMRAMPDRFYMEVRGDTADKDPRVFTGIEMIYFVEGTTEKDKLLKAVKLSQETYCSLSIMVKKVTEFRYTVILNGEVIGTGN